MDPEPTVAPVLQDTLHYHRPTYTSLQSAVLLPVISKERLCIFYFPNTVNKVSHFPYRTLGAQLFGVFESKSCKI